MRKYKQITLAMTLMFTLFNLKAQTWDDKKLTPPSRNANDYFGSSISINGDYMVIGSYGKSSNRGTACLYKNIAGTWTYVKNLNASDSAQNDKFGYSVAISGDYIVIGAPSEDEDANGSATLTNAGSAYIFYKNEGGADNWGQLQKIVAFDRTASDEFGNAVDIEGDCIVVGAYRNGKDINGNNLIQSAGAAYIFSNTSGTWTQHQKITSTLRSTSAQFGFSLAIDGDYIAIGANWENEGSNAKAGAAYIFKNSSGVWAQQKRILATDCFAYNEFGYSIAISGELVLIGAPFTPDFMHLTSAYMFKRDQGGVNNWGKTNQFSFEVPIGFSYGFAHALAIDGETAVIGGINAGAIYFLKKQSWDGKYSEWEFDKVVAFDKDYNDDFSSAISISGNNIAVGAPQDADDATGNNQIAAAGSAYIVQPISVTTWSGTAWSNGLPTITTNAVLEGNYKTSIHGSITANKIYIVNNDTLIAAETGDATATKGFELISKAGYQNGTLYSCDNSLDGQVVSGNLINETSPSISQQPVDYLATENGNYTFQVTSTGDNLNYSWRREGLLIQRSGSNIYNGTNVPYSYNSNQFTVEVYNHCGSEVSSAATLIVNPLTTSVTDSHTEAGSYSVFSENKTIFVQSEDMNLEICISDQCGKIIGSGKSALVNAAGIYFVRVNSGKENHTHKVLVE